MGRDAAGLNPLDAARNLFPRVYPRMVEIIQQIGASGLVAMPMEADLEGRSSTISVSTIRQRARKPSTAFRCSGWPGMRRSPHSHHARCCTSASSSAIRCAWPEQ